MEELIKITEKEGKRVVSARELHVGLGYNASHWSKWHPKNISNNTFAIEGVDWVLAPSAKSPENGGRQTVDYALTIDFAKRLSMMARTPQGEKMRDYFIECEKAMIAASIKPMSIEEMIIANAQLLIETKSRLATVEEKVKMIEAQSVTSPMDFFAIAGYASLMKIKVDSRAAAKIGKKASALCRDLGYMMGNVPDAKYGMVHTYPSEVLKIVFDEHFTVKA